MKANGCENTLDLLDLSVNEILKKRFNVGTEKPKSFHYSEPKDEELVPLRLMNTVSDNKKAKKKLKSLTVEPENEENETSDENQEIEEVNELIIDDDSGGGLVEGSYVVGSVGTSSSSNDDSHDHSDAKIQSNSISRGQIRPALKKNKVPSATNITAANEVKSKKLPPGWKENFSKTKNLPYYTHPEYGSTW